MSGAFVVFEGGDGAGKSTQTAELVTRLLARGYAVTRTFEPGDSPAGQEIRRILLDPATGALSPRAESLLYAADKAQHVDAVVRPALARGEIVVCDRYVDSMLAYQGAHGMAVADLERLAAWATGGLHPDLTVLLDVDPAEAVAGKADKDRIEGFGDGFHSRARALLLELSERAPERYLVLPARDSVESIAARVERRVLALAAVRDCRTARAD